MYGIFYLVLLTFHHWPLLDVLFRMLILQIFLNVVCIDLWLCCYFTYFLNAVYVIQTLCVNVYFGAFCKCVLLRLVVLLAVLLSSLVLLYRL